MARLVQIRAVPEDVHRTLKARAAHAGRSLSEYLRAELALIAARPTPDEVRVRLRAQPPTSVRERPAAILRRARGALR
jgi:plasmid stability protein